MLTRGPTLRIIGLCFMWYLCSAMNNNLNKAILSRFPYPVVLVWIQFVFTAIYARGYSLFSDRKGHPIDMSNLISVLPLSLMMIAGHVLTSTSLSFIAISLVHTIKVSNGINQWPQGAGSIVHSRTVEGHLSHRLLERRLQSSHSPYGWHHASMLWWIWVSQDRCFMCDLIHRTKLSYGQQWRLFLSFRICFQSLSLQQSTWIHTPTYSTLQRCLLCFLVFTCWSIPPHQQHTKVKNC